MPILPVNQVAALSSGADLWVGPDHNHSAWIREMDWFLNHIILKKDNHEVRKMDHEVRGLLFQNQIVFQDVVSPNSDLLVAASHQLPTQWLMIVPWNGQIEKWLAHVHNNWKNLKYPSLRLFLPKGVSVSECSRVWQKVSDHQDFTVVLDKE